MPNIRLPDWAKEVIMPGGELEQLVSPLYTLYSATPEMTKLTCGYLLKEILDRFTNKTQSKLIPDRSLWMYFTHDIIISNMLNSLRIYKVRICIVMGFKHCNRIL